MQFIDTHCHIHTAQLELLGDPGARALWLRANSPQPQAMIDRAAQKGVNRMICVGTTVADSRLAVDFAAQHPQCWASIGIHPHEAKGGKKRLADLAALLSQDVTGPGLPNKIVAIGECGLDYFYQHSPKKDQIAILRAHIELALTHNLPLIFHVREAFDDFWPIFDSYSGVRGVLHSFTDNHTNFAKAMQRGLYIGVNGIMTFTKNDWQLRITKEIPLQKLLIETDAPFLTPVPFRGTVNEPAHVRVVAEFLARLRGESLTAIAAATTSNAQTLFIM